MRHEEVDTALGMVPAQGEFKLLLALPVRGDFIVLLNHSN